MIDRLKDFQRIAQRKGIKLEAPSSSETRLTVENSEEIDGFKRLVTDGHKTVDRINNLTIELQVIKGEIFKTSGERERELKKNVNKIEDNFESLRREGKITADEMKKKTKEFEEKVEKIKEEKKIPYYGESDIRMINNLYNSFLKNFEQAINDAASIMSDIKIEQQNKLIRDAENILGEISEEKKSEIIKNPDLVNDMMENKLTQGLASVQLKNKVRDLEERHEDIVKLENVSIF
jgi:hypothetical protein